MASTYPAPSSPHQKRSAITAPPIQPNADVGVSLRSPSEVMMDSSSYPCSPESEARSWSGSGRRGEEGEDEGMEMRGLAGEDGEDDDEVEDDEVEAIVESEGGVELGKPTRRDIYMSEPALACCPHPRHRLMGPRRSLLGIRPPQQSAQLSKTMPLPMRPQTLDQATTPSAMPRASHRRRRQYASLADRPQVDPTAPDFQVPGRAYMSDDWRQDQERHALRVEEAKARKWSKS